MDLLLKHVQICDPGQEGHGELRDIAIVDGNIEALSDYLDEANFPGAKVLDLAGMQVSPGWMDLGARVGEPGLEHRETLASLAAAAAAGGYTEVAVFPNTEPAIHSGSEVAFVRAASKDLPVGISVIGAVSSGTAGKDLAEMLDMRSAGALAFSDGKKPVHDAGLLLRALQYSSGFGGLIINMPYDPHIAPKGQMHEGIQSTSLGLSGIPGLAETLALDRDLAILAYAGGQLHVFNVSTAEGVARIRQAKAEGLPVTASAAAMNLAFNDEKLGTFDSQYKVMPPLRAETDRQALIAGILDGTLDAINSNHEPLEEEHKKLEFTYAKFGVIGLETTFALCRTYCPEIEADKLAQVLAQGARKVLSLPRLRIAAGEAANLSFFSAGETWTYQAEKIRSLSRNSPLIGQALTGRSRAILRGSQQWGLLI